MPGIEIEEARLLVIDADLLGRQYLQLTKGKLTAEQRKQWAKEMAAVLEQLALVVREAKPCPYSPAYEFGAWNKQMRAGQRLATYK